MLGGESAGGPIDSGRMVSQKEPRGREEWWAKALQHATLRDESSLYISAKKKSGENPGRVRKRKSKYLWSLVQSLVSSEGHAWWLGEQPPNVSTPGAGRDEFSKKTMSIKN